MHLVKALNEKARQPATWRPTHSPSRSLRGRRPEVPGICSLLQLEGSSLHGHGDALRAEPSMGPRLKGRQATRREPLPLSGTGSRSVPCPQPAGGAITCMNWEPGTVAEKEGGASATQPLRLDRQSAPCDLPRTLLRPGTFRSTPRGFEWSRLNKITPVVCHD